MGFTYKCGSMAKPDLRCALRVSLNARAQPLDMPVVGVIVMESG